MPRRGPERRRRARGAGSRTRAYPYPQPAAPAWKDCWIWPGRETKGSLRSAQFEAQVDDQLDRVLRDLERWPGLRLGLLYTGDRFLVQIIAAGVLYHHGRQHRASGFIAKRTIVPPVRRNAAPALEPGEIGAQGVLPDCGHRCTG